MLTLKKDLAAPPIRMAEQTVRETGSVVPVRIKGVVRALRKGRFLLPSCWAYMVVVCLIGILHLFSVIIGLVY